MNKIRTASLILVIALFSIGVMGQQAKFGHVNSQYVIQLMPQYDSVAKVLMDLDSMYNVTLEKLQVEININIDQYNKLPDSPELIKEVKAQEIQQMQVRAQAFQQRAQEDLQTRPAQLMRPLYTKIIDAINELAEENGLVYVFDVSQGNPLYVSDKSLDLVPLILKKFDIKPDPTLESGIEMQF